MRVGWILDVRIDGSRANIWVKLDDGKVIRLTDSYRPDFYIELKDGLAPEDVDQTILLHPFVSKAVVEEKYTSILNREKSKVIHVFARDTSSVRAVREDLEKLNITKSWFNIDLYHFQRYLFSKTFAPTNKVEVEWDEWKNLVDVTAIDDSEEIAPPPFSSILFEVAVKSGKLTPDMRSDPVRKIALRCKEGEVEVLEGDESDIFASFTSRIRAFDPDFLVVNDCEETLSYLLERAKIRGIDLQLGREPIKDYIAQSADAAVKGRAIVDLDDFLEYGVAGITELSRFTLAPPTFSAKWPAGKTIDARQSFEALKKDILVPKRREFPRFAMTAREIHEKDKGGLLFSPTVGLHENVAELDFESMFPNIIIHHNVSYETVTPTHIDKTRQGFLGEVVRSVLDRRLRFKHLRKRFPKGSDEYRWCDQRQKALKSVLVCIYGFSGCFANRFNNVAAYNEINAIARRVLVQTVNLCLARDFEVLYVNTDSVFIKRQEASREDYEELAKSIEKETDLPIALDHHFRLIVFMKQRTHRDVEAMNRFYGKLTNGELYYRGIEMRRRDCPVFLKRFQERLMEILFDASDKYEVVERKVAEAKVFTYNTYRRTLGGEVNPLKLSVTKRVRKEVDAYRSMFPHVVAAKHLSRRGKKLEEHASVDFVYTNAEHRNPMRRVLPMDMMSDERGYYDREKYGRLLLEVADTILKPFEKDPASHPTLDSFKNA